MRKKTPENFTDQEWKEYLDKLWYIKPLNDKEWEEFEQMLSERNHNSKFYPSPFVPNNYPIPESRVLEPPKRYKQKKFEEYLVKNHFDETLPKKQHGFDLYGNISTTGLCIVVGIIMTIFIILFSLF